MIRANKLNKSYGSLHVLKDVDLHILPSEIVTLVGASGAGKTTLLQIVGTLDKADKGSVLINNREITSLNDKEISKFRNQEIGFVYQFHHLLSEFTALENVMLPALIARTDKK